MELKKLNKETLGCRSKKGIATITFTRRGLVILSARAVEKLGLSLYTVTPDNYVDIFQGDRISEFFISKGLTYRIRKNGEGGVVFNCISLCSLIMEKSWQVVPHAATEKMPDKFSFIICDNPIDDKENSGVFALLRKKV